MACKLNLNDAGSVRDHQSPRRSMRASCCRPLARHSARIFFAFSASAIWKNNPSSVVIWSVLTSAEKR